MKKLMTITTVVASFAFGMPAMAQTKPTIPILVKDTTSPYWQAVLAGARKAGQDLGVHVTELGARSDADFNGQIGLLEKAVASNPSAIVIAPAQSAALAKPIEDAAKKVKIVGIDSTVDSTSITSQVMTDDAQAGRIAARALADAIKKSYADTEGDVAIIGSSADLSIKGFKEETASKFGALAVVAERVADGQATTGNSIMVELIDANPELRGVLVVNPALAQGAAQAVAAAKTNKTGDKINFVAFGSDEKLVKFLQDGTISALVVRDPFRIGYDGVKTALAAAKGEKVPATVDTGANLITKANLNTSRSQELLNPKID
jgi:ribose transport system substrate-binding protein